jgi:hypothetical protein
MTGPPSGLPQRASESAARCVAGTSCRQQRRQSNDRSPVRPAAESKRKRSSMRCRLRRYKLSLRLTSCRQQRRQSNDRSPVRPAAESKRKRSSMRCRLRRYKLVLRLTSCRQQRRQSNDRSPVRPAAESKPKAQLDALQATALQTILATDKLQAAAQAEQ